MAKVLSFLMLMDPMGSMTTPTSRFITRVYPSLPGVSPAPSDLAAPVRRKTPSRWSAVACSPSLELTRRPQKEAPAFGGGRRGNHLPVVKTEERVRRVGEFARPAPLGACNL
jgi:hypothetical protein